MFRHCIILVISLFFSSVYASDLISLFPLAHYDQKPSTWIKSSDPDYKKSLLSARMQKQHMDNFYKKYLSPWDVVHVKHILEQVAPDDLATIEKEQLTIFNNTEKPNHLIGYGENFRPYSAAWIKSIQENINFKQLTHAKFQMNNRAIAIDNLHARLLPTDDVYFYDHDIAGQGYPFDNLQTSAVWAGTPLYVIAETNDHVWSLVLTPDFIAWVKSNGIARASDFFIMLWVHQTRRQLAAITHTNTSLVDENMHYLFSGYVGMIFPAIEKNNTLRLSVPVADANHYATIKYVTVSKKYAHIMPLRATPKNFAKIIQTLIHRPYGWGNMYFYNDCSAELKNLLTPFGIWLPRNSFEQISAGNVRDFSKTTAEQRLSYLKKLGRKFLTLVYIDGHIFLYIGNYPNPHSSSHTTMVMTYQNVWGLKASDPNGQEYRAVIGQAVFFPLLLRYPENSSIKSQASKKYFKISFLDEPVNYVKQPDEINLRNIMGIKE